MSLEIIAAAVFAFTMLLSVAGFIWYRLPKKLKVEEFTAKWKQLQAHCRNTATWPQAIEEADALLGTALKKRKIKGGSMGEKLVSAGSIFTDNDSIWAAHNLYKKVKADPEAKLKENEVKNALVGFRQALRDLGALK